MKGNSNNKTIKSAFTLAEVLITLTVIGALATLTIPLLKNAIPDKYEAMHKRSDYLLEHTVSDLVNDEYLYGAQKDVNTDPPTIIYGLRNTYKVTVDGETYGDNDPNEAAAGEKFCRLFASRFKLAPGSEVNCSNNPGFSNNGSTPTFTSVDGVEWIIPTSTFDNSISIAYRVSSAVDNRSPRCVSLTNDFRDNETIKNNGFIDLNNSPNCEKPDTFLYILTPEGKLIKDTPTSDSLSPSTAVNNIAPSSIPTEVAGAVSSPRPLNPDWGSSGTGTPGGWGAPKPTAPRSDSPELVPPGIKTSGNGTSGLNSGGPKRSETVGALSY